MLGLALMLTVAAFNVPWERQLPPTQPASTARPPAIPGCTHGRLKCVVRVERRLRAQYEALDAACDHRVIAALAYLRITEALHEDLAREEPRFFRHRRWMAFVITDFSNAYFDAFAAYERGDPVPAAWREFYDVAATGDTTAIHDLLLFSNAHAQHDLPFSYARMGLRSKADHDGVNEINVRVIPGVKAEIERRYDPTIRDVPGPFDEMAGLEPTKGWRETAWRNAERLASAPDAAAREQVAAQIDAYSATWGRTIAGFPSPPGTRATRDAHCAASA